MEALFSRGFTFRFSRRRRRCRGIELLPALHTAALQTKARLPEAKATARIRVASSDMHLQVLHMNRWLRISIKKKTVMLMMKMKKNLMMMVPGTFLD